MHEDPNFKSEFNERYSLVSRKLLRALSEDSRRSISDLSKQLGLSRKTTKERLLKLEKELGVRYTVELNEDRLGVANPHLIMVRFSKKPDHEHLRRVFARSSIPQIVVAVKGTYDLFIYANAHSRDEYVHWDKSTQISLAEYGVSWYPAEVAHRQLGFYPLRNELIERIEMPQKYKSMLKILNTNGRASFQEISKQTGMHFNTVAYNYKKLLEMGYVKRFTLVMDKPADVTMMTLFDKYRISAEFEQDARATRAYFKADDENSLISRYIFVNELVGGNDFFCAGVFDSVDIARKRFMKPYKRAQAPDKPRTFYGAVDEVLLGSLPIRSLDTKKEYSTLVWSPEPDSQ